METKKKIKISEPKKMLFSLLMGSMMLPQYRDKWVRHAAKMPKALCRIRVLPAPPRGQAGRSQGTRDVAKNWLSIFS